MSPLATKAVRHLASIGALSPMELWAFDLGPLPAGEDVSHRQDATLLDRSVTGAVAVSQVLAGDDLVSVAASDQGVGLSLVHDDEREAEGFQPEGQEGADAPSDAAPVGSLGRLSFRTISVRPSDAVVERLLGNPKRQAAAAQETHQRVLIANQKWLDRHPDAPNSERPR